MNFIIIKIWRDIRPYSWDLLEIKKIIGFKISAVLGLRIFKWSIKFDGLRINSKTMLYEKDQINIPILEDLDRKSNIISI